MSGQAVGEEHLPPLLVYYGGTFDPIHLGHLAIAKAAAQALAVPVRLMPAADPPHRAAPGASAVQRAQMLELAVAGEPALLPELREIARAARQPRVPSFTVDTLREVRSQYGPAQPVALLLGADSLLGLPGWHDWKALLGLAHFIVAERPGSALDSDLPPELAAHLHGAWVDGPRCLFEAPSGRVLRLQQPLRQESASGVRAAIANGQPWAQLVPPAVAGYIRLQRLYGA